MWFHKLPSLFSARRLHIYPASARDVAKKAQFEDGHAVLEYPKDNTILVIGHAGILGKHAGVKADISPKASQ